MKTLTLALAALLTAPAVLADDSQPANMEMPAPDHALIEADVFGETGTMLGQVSQVELAEDGTVAALIVETSGATDAEIRQVRIIADDFRLDDLELGWRVSANFTAEEFAALPDFVPTGDDANAETGSDS
ncbi:hypothetical protein [Maricaulis sp. W15]|uniref:hypothetical protein n=1 Tax=Maricaulis sp. W15 TaxID=1772333 RepID=UPI000B1D4417|nr:hypothetical protein [Maricaulis sp. W15]